MAFVQKIKDIYGENLAEKVRMVHDYLGMTFYYSFDDEVCHEPFAQPRSSTMRKERAVFRRTKFTVLRG